MSTAEKPAAIVLLGTPFTALDAWGQRLAHAIGGTWLGDLNVSMARTVGELLQLWAVAQIPLHEPLHVLLQKTLPEAKADPQAFLEKRADWSMARLLDHLRDNVAKPVVCSDVSAGFRVRQVEHWFAMQPDARFVHVTSALAPFVAGATRFYTGKLYVPPDYRDHCVVNTVAPIKPELAWYQVHATLARAFGDNAALRRCRLPLEATPPPTLAAFDDFCASQRAKAAFAYPFADDHRQAMAPTLPALADWIGQPLKA